MLRAPKVYSSQGKGSGMIPDTNNTSKYLYSIG